MTRRQVYANPAILIAHTRSGGTFVNHCLSNHPQIYCPRGEPLLQGAEYYTAFPKAGKRQILHLVTRATHYRVGMCKVTYEQLDEVIWVYLKSRKAKVLHLVRENMPRVVVSQIITGMVASRTIEHEAHTFHALKPIKVSIPADLIIRRCNRQWADIKAMRHRLSKSGLNVKHLLYRQLVGYEGQEANQITESVAFSICDFLGVERRPLRTSLKKVNPWLMKDLLSNWSEVRKSLMNSPFKKYVDS